LLLVFGAIIVMEIRAQREAAQTLTPQQAVLAMNNKKMVIIDLREPASFEKSHIINAINVSKSDFDGAKMNKYKSKDILLVCDRGTLSTTLANKIHAKGFLNAKVLAGGIAAWQQANLPLIKGDAK